MKGYTKKRLRIDLTNQTYKIEQIPEDELVKYIGGRGLNMYVLAKEVPVDCNPLGEENKLIIGVGPLSGTSFSGSARVNFSGKSPQTNILGDSNAGGFFGPEIKYAGYDQIIIEGKASSLTYLFIKDDQVMFEDANHLQYADTFVTNQKILQDIGDSRVQIACIGGAAERGVVYSGIFCNLVRAAARTGMGRLMAAKNLKAIAVRGTKTIKVHNPQEYRAIIDEVNQNIFNHYEFPIRLHMGTTKLLSALNNMGCLATNHYQTGYFPQADKVSGETLAKTYKVKNKACFGCNVPCSRFLNVPEKDLKTEGPEFEGLAGFSSKLGIDDLATTLECIDICNKEGIDIISVAECIGFSMELFQRGILTIDDTGLDLSWGNSESVLKLLKLIAMREGFGEVLADGVVKAAQKIGKGAMEYAFHVKGLEFFMADPRGIKGYALGVAVASRGGDHLRSEPSFEFYEDKELGLARFGYEEAAFRLEYKGKGLVVKHYEELCALADSLNVCKNTLVNMEVLGFEEAANLLKATTGLEFSSETVERACERIINLERMYLINCGIDRKDDTLPKRFLEEPLPKESKASAGSVVELSLMLDEYYLARGWDILTGKPSLEKLEELALTEFLR